MTVEDYFSLNEQPFTISPDPRFLYLSDQVKQAVAKCEYMTTQRRGPLYMYGPIGSGKTSMLRRFWGSVEADDRFNVATVFTPNLRTANAFLRVIMDQYGVKTARAYDRSLSNFEDFLVEQHDEGDIPILIVDEAQNLRLDTLRLVHHLLNFETDKVKLLQILLVGQMELSARIQRFEALASRMFPIAINPMSHEELREMIEFRWMVAGGDNPPFAEGAYDEIFVYSRGVPRNAVKICDEALRRLFSTKATRMGVEGIRECASDLDMYREP